MVVIPELPDSVLVIHLPLPASVPNAEQIEEEANQLIGAVLSLLLSLSSCAQWLQQERSSRLAIRGIWERTWSEYLTMVNEARNTVARLRTLSSSSELSSRILTLEGPSPYSVADYLGHLLYPYEQLVKHGTE